MEQIIFLHNDEAAWDVLRQIQQSTAQRVVLVIPPHLERLRLNMLLRLIRRQTAGQSQHLVVVSEDHLVQVLAERMGCVVAATLDEYHGLLPGYVASPKKGARRPRVSSRAQLPPQDVILSPEGRVTRPAPSLPSGDSLRSWVKAIEAEQPSPRQSGQFEPADQEERGKPSANLDTILIDGHLTNPGATPGLDEADELADDDASQRLHYEIVDESHPDQAQQESAAREAHIIAKIRQTSALDPDVTPPKTQTPQAKTSPSARAQPEQRGRLRPMRSIDELIDEYGHTELFEWLAAQAASPTTNTPASERQTHAADAGRNAATGEQKKSQDQSTPISKRPFIRPFARRTRLHQRNQRQPDHQPPQTNTSNRLARTTTTLLRRISIAFILALSLLMTCAGLALLPSAQVSYRIAIEPYSETLTLDAQPGTGSPPDIARTGRIVPAVVAQFDGVLVAQASATGHQATKAGSPQEMIPTQSDVDLTASLLRQQLNALGQTTLLTQIRPGDISGPVIATEQIQALPGIGTPLPDGVSTFQVSLALHLRQMIVRQQTLQQTVWARINEDLAHFKHGFTLAAGQRLALNVVTSAPPAIGTALPALRLIIQTAGTIVPALSPDQARAAIAGMSINNATSYLSQQPGISHVSIGILPKWLNRLPIFAVRIRIKLES